MPTADIASVRLPIPDSLFKEYERQAQQLNLDVEELLIRRLSETRDQSNEKGRSIKVSPEDRQKIETAFSHSFRDGRELAAHLLSVYGVTVDGITIQLSPDLLKRLDGRRGRMEFKAFVTETIVRQLEHFAGMR